MRPTVVIKCLLFLSFFDLEANDVKMLIAFHATFHTLMLTRSSGFFGHCH